MEDFPCDLHGRCVGVSERALAVLDALLTFHPETALTGEALTVFPSNEQLSLRAHGMPASTLRRHLAVLVDAGSSSAETARTGSATCAGQGRGDDFTHSVSTFLRSSPAPTNSKPGPRSRCRGARLKLARERITLCRRDIAKMIATGIEEGVPPPGRTEGPASWQGDLHVLYRGMVGRVPRTATRPQIEAAAEALAQLADEMRILLETQVKTQK